MMIKIAKYYPMQVLMTVSYGLIYEHTSYEWSCRFIRKQLTFESFQTSKEHNLNNRKG